MKIREHSHFGRVMFDAGVESPCCKMSLLQDGPISRWVGAQDDTVVHLTSAIKDDKARTTAYPKSIQNALECAHFEGFAYLSATLNHWDFTSLPFISFQFAGRLGQT
jgi:hypothetical protein